MSSKSGAGGQKAGGGLAELKARLEPIVESAVTGIGYELDDLELAQMGRKRQVKAIVDAEGGIELDEVASISRAVSKALDEHEDVLEGSYTLEVTSPGLDRPLTKPRHWRRARARLVKLTFADGGSAKARVGAADEREVRLLFDAKSVRTVGYTEIQRAVVEVEFRKPPTAELELLGLQDQEGSE
ncbi:ribosome maturation factor RimP [Sciscionella sediminilitoris]|uniref:ribosome maturation factor RimP n=1 Tax=Sciscionella sediminilitoris TaxID=1445613 RepID=UPI00068D9C19|nr:ribosome maturation factor RimP [Sciscionella sp. SE31]